MKRHIFALVLFSLLTALLVTACAGEDKKSVDTQAPAPPSLVRHLGDTGDLPIEYNGAELVFTEENNGIDAVPDGNWIRVSWKPFIDNDVSHVHIWRFDEYNTEPELIDNIPANSRQYVDSKEQLNIGTRYSYFIDLFDFSGNSSRSDTVSYALLSKVNLISPANNALVSTTDIDLTWQRSGFASKYRAIVFDEDYKYVWHQDIVVSFEEDIMHLPFPTNLASEHSGESLYWRVDSFEWDSELEMEVGSESGERIIHIQ